MSELSLDDFPAFFSEVNGFPPFQWQSRLCRYIVENGRWPDAINAPTGSGKSSVVDVHLFVNALDGVGVGPRVPRRLAVVVGRRAIVDSHYGHASETVLTSLRTAPPESITERVSAGLQALSTVADVAEPFQSSILRGGMPRDSNWIDDPAACAVICATPDMFGSRLLFGGYGSSRNAWPREAGALARDTVMVLDEAHLNEQLLISTRRVRDLQSADGIAIPAVQVVATTATPTAEEQEVVGVTPDDLLIDTVLRDRLQKPKPVQLVTSEHWPGARRPSRNYAKQIAGLVRKQVAERDGDGTVGCIVNSVFTAREVARALGAELGPEAVILWVGPMRPLDLREQQERHPRAFTVDGDPDVRVIVATQTLEVGVDVDLAALVTELAPGSAIAQRAGRVNRLGRRDSGPCVVVVPEVAPTAGSGPYEQDELTESFEWLQRRADDPSGLAPVQIQIDSAPQGARCRAVLSRIELGDVQAFSSTSEEQIAAVDLDRWIRDDLSAEPAGVGLVRRGPLPIDDLDALALLRATPVSPDEVYPVGIGTAREVVDQVIRRAKAPYARVFLRRAGQLDVVDLSDDQIDIRPGDVLIVDASHPIVDNRLIVAKDGESSDATVWGPPESVEVYVDGHDPDWVVLRDLTSAVRDAIEDRPDGETEEQATQRAMDAFVEDLGEAGELRVSAARLKVTAPPLPEDAGQRLAWVVIADADPDRSDDESRQSWTGTAVLLSSHQEDVAARARELGNRLGLSSYLVDALERAGRFHDEGKRHSGFQEILGGDSNRVLAKSAGRDAGEPKRRRSRVNLARGWRHEQLSVVYASAELESDDPEFRDLVLRLIGSSHGRGRSGFVNSADEVLSGETPELMSVARGLFDEGGWEELIDLTERRWGTWECAYLEAILRAADCMVSKEGA
ncbi:type I-G CRISPR-associated helicase/endonuclease Cas3g [Gordonia iterans]